jgi:hypothetical protein
MVRRIGSTVAALLFAVVWALVFSVGHSGSVKHVVGSIKHSAGVKRDLGSSLRFSATKSLPTAKTDTTTKGKGTEGDKTSATSAHGLPLAKTDTTTKTIEEKKTKTAAEEKEETSHGTKPIPQQHTSESTKGTGPKASNSKDSGSSGSDVPPSKKQAPAIVSNVKPVDLPGSNYHRWARPDSTPVVVQFRIVLQYLFALSQRDEMLDVGFKVYRMWKDERLVYESKAPYDKEGYEIDVKSIWVPNFEIRNAVEKHILNEDVIVFPDGTVVYSQRIRAKVTVDFDVGWFPFDAQELHLQYAMFGRSTSKNVVVDSQTLDWKPAFPDQKAVSNFLIDPDLAGTTQMSWIIQNFTGKVDSLTNEATKMAYKEVMCTLSIQRGKFHYLLVFLAPMIFIVLTGTANFHFDVRDLEPRIQIAAALLLALVALQYSIEQSLPQVSYAIWINWYLFICYCFLFFQACAFVWLVYIAGPREDGTWTRKPHQEDQQLAQNSLEGEITSASEEMTQPLLPDEESSKIVVTSYDGKGNATKVVVEKISSEREKKAKLYNKYLAWGYPLGFLVINIIMFGIVPNLLS